MPLWAMAVVGGVSLVVLGVGGFFAIHAQLGAKDKPLAAGGASQVPAAAGGGGLGDLGSGAPGGTKYVPRVSEQKLQQFLEGRDSNDVTEDQVYAIMGPPTRRDTPVTVRKQGQVFIAYTAVWEVPGSGVTSKITFANGRLGGMILGLEITSEGAGDRK